MSDGPKIGPVICALCGRLVDEVSIREDMMTRSFILVARCHGAVDRREIGMSDVMDSPGLEAAMAEGGTAFDQVKAIPQTDRIAP